MMPKATRYMVTGTAFHVTRRRGRDFLFRSARDRNDCQNIVHAQSGITRGPALVAG